MPSNPAELSESEAQSLMSQLMDGEISPADADSLYAYLDRHPEAMQWMESASLIGEQSDQGIALADTASAWKEIRATIGEKPVERTRSAALLAFPTLLKGIGIAASLALAATLFWIAAPQSNPQITERYAASESVVEFVDTEIPDASPIVYTDERSGWTVVWVTEMEPISDEAG